MFFRMHLRPLKGAVKRRQHCRVQRPPYFCQPKSLLISLHPRYKYRPPIYVFPFILSNTSQRFRQETKGKPTLSRASHKTLLPQHSIWRSQRFSAQIPHAMFCHMPLRLPLRAPNTPPAIHQKTKTNPTYWHTKLFSWHIFLFLGGQEEKAFSRTKLFHF